MTEWQPNPEAWRADYARDGYVVVANVVESALLEALRGGLEQVEQGMNDNTLPANLRRHVYTERDRTRNMLAGKFDNDAISNIMELPLFAPVFRDLIVYPRVLDILEALFETTEFSFHNYKCICKMPGNEAPFQWHRDLPYLRHTSSNLITCMLCLDPMTEENGATVVCPGSHCIPDEAVKDSDTDIPEAEVPAERVTVTCPAGSAVLFHASIVHGGGPNRSTMKRRNAISIWAGPDTYPVTPHHYAYEFVMPRSTNAARQKQIQLIFGEKDR
jgi:ectoine hydroxylase-related dioxygenase (phytanoyl-CoA dioxygenase family)